MIILSHGKATLRRWKIDFRTFCLMFCITITLCIADNDHRNSDPMSTGYNNNDESVHYIFETESLPDDKNLLPTLSNGHIGFTTFGDTVHMNGLYNGKFGLSHRARIPNWANIQFWPIDYKQTINYIYRFNAKTGVFSVSISNSDMKIVHRLYVHRFYTRAIVNEVEINRLNSDGDITIKVDQNTGNTTKDITFNSTTTISMNDQSINATCGYTNEVEDPEYQTNGKHVCVLWNHVPEEITLEKSRQVMSYRFVMTVDGDLNVATQEIINVLEDENVLESHELEWNKFWESFNIKVTANSELSQVIYASIYYLTSALPSMNTSSPEGLYYGISPTGLGRGETLDDYEGHSMWDTEIWMHPVILLMNPKWSETLLHYRKHMLQMAIIHASSGGYDGARFPWEIAFTGREVTQPCCPLVAKNQLHITADVSFAVRNHFGITNDFEWLSNEGCSLAIEIAKFWASRVTFNETTTYYEIRDIMGPDEDNPEVSNNGYTNVVVGYALYFADFASCLCNINRTSSTFDDNSKWSDIARHLRLVYDKKANYHPQYEGYQLNDTIKQADAILIGYPLLYKMDRETRKNDLLFYENVTRSSGPAMTWAMHTINHLDVNEIDKADVMFLRSYKNYIRPPFNVWSEVGKGEFGAINFLTGSGGFLQAIINGYAGIRIHIDHLEINNPRVPGNTNSLTVSGIKYLGSSFEIDIKENVTILTCLSLNPEKPLKISDGVNTNIVVTGAKYQTKFVTIKPIENPFGNCPLPKDVIGIPSSGIKSRLFTYFYMIFCAIIFWYF